MVLSVRREPAPLFLPRPPGLPLWLWGSRCEHSVGLFREVEEDRLPRDPFFPLHFLRCWGPWSFLRAAVPQKGRLPDGGTGRQS